MALASSKSVCMLDVIIRQNQITTPSPLSQQSILISLHSKRNLAAFALTLRQIIRHVALFGLTSLLDNGWSLARKANATVFIASQCTRKVACNPIIRDPAVGLFSVINTRFMTFITASLLSDKKTTFE